MSVREVTISIGQARRALQTRTHLCTSLDTAAQHAHAQGAVVLDSAVVELFKRDAVLEGAVLDELALGDELVLAGDAHCEAEVDFGVRVELGGAQLEDVAHALVGAVLALDAVVLGRGANVREGEVDLVVDAHHGGQDELLETVLGVGALAHDVRLERDEVPVGDGSGGRGERWRWRIVGSVWCVAVELPELGLAVRQRAYPYGRALGEAVDMCGGVVAAVEAVEDDGEDEEEGDGAVAARRARRAGGGWCAFLVLDDRQAEAGLAGHPESA